MATLHLTPATTVAELRKQFNDAFGAQVKVYSGRSIADLATSLSDLGLNQTIDFECRASLTVASFIERMQEECRLKVKVYTCDEWVAVLDGLTLESAGNVKKNAVKADMENMIAYQRTEGSQSKFKTFIIPRDHLCSPRRPNGTHYIDELFLWDKKDIYNDVEILVFPKDTHTDFKKCDLIRCSIDNDEIPKLKEVRIPKEWEDQLKVPKGVKKVKY